MLFIIAKKKTLEILKCPSIYILNIIFQRYIPTYEEFG